MPQVVGSRFGGSMASQYLIDLLDQALKSPAGLRIKTKDADALRRRLYVAMRSVREARGPDSERFSALQLRISPDDGNTLEIHKRDIK